MMGRNLSPQEMFIRLAGEHVPRLQFAGTTVAEFLAWKEAALPPVRATLGAFPDPVPPNPQLQVEWVHDGLLKQRWIIDVSRHISAVVQVNFPRDREGKLPAILCWHGHFPGGKETVMGNTSSPQLAQTAAAHNGAYGHAMAKAGFVTFGLDWFGYGDRRDGDKPNWRSQPEGKDWCDVYYLHATMLGMTPLGIYVAHGMAATDFVCTLPRVDGGRIGVMGLSAGGTLALWSALCDARIGAAELICYSDLWAAFGFRDINYCGMEIAPGLFSLVDVPDLQGLLAPLPLLDDIGVHDACYKADTAMECYRRVERIYRAAGASERLELDLFDGGHAWGMHKSVAFFGRYLDPGRRVQ